MYWLLFLSSYWTWIRSKRQREGENCHNKIHDSMVLYKTVWLYYYMAIARSPRMSEVNTMNSLFKLTIFFWNDWVHRKEISTFNRHCRTFSLPMTNLSKCIEINWWLPAVWIWLSRISNRTLVLISIYFFSSIAFKVLRFRINMRRISWGQHLLLKCDTQRCVYENVQLDMPRVCYDPNEFQAKINKLDCHGTSVMGVMWAFV